ncbi:MAG: ribosome biogenesis GTPase Der [Candidatus Aminicenantes bacterium]|nr:ribosome biogenesis GTPase Der [Candidatus Aminicenantes bacterium]
MPQVVILGFPNVGKSTLFNRLLGRKVSLIHTLPGMTRDAVSALGELDGKKFILTDTGGMFDASEGSLAGAISERAWEAARNADVILLVLDGKRELSPAEEELHVSLRKLGKPLLVVLNKIDSEVGEGGLGDWYNRLKADPLLAVSAEHKRNLDDLEWTLAGHLSGPAPEKEALRALRVAIIGRTNVGKSSLINRLCGENRLIVSRAPGTTRDTIDTFVVRNKKLFCLVDTAGIRRLSRTRDKREKASIVRAKRDIGRADVLCQVLDAGEFPTRQDMTIARLAAASGKPLLLALNKWDLIPSGESPRVIETSVSRGMSFVSYAPLLFVSALTGKGVVKILDQAEVVYERSSRRVETPRLNEFLAWINATHPPLTRTKRRLKIRYMTQKGIRPPTFILFAHTPAALLPASERFFLQALRERFDLRGTPLRLILRKS